MIIGAPSVALSQGPHFLFLPFNDQGVTLQQGWLYNFPGPFDCLPPEGNLCHRGIDYRKGQSDPSTWVSFSVLAAAHGRAIATQSKDYGKLVYIAHDTIDAQSPRFYSLYGHLASSADGIPYKDKKDVLVDIANGDFASWAEVDAGHEVGSAGKTGLSNNVIHLHFEVHRGGWAQSKTDPYDIYDTRSAYPTPCGPNFLWTECPPVAFRPPPQNEVLFEIIGSATQLEGIHYTTGQTIRNEDFRPGTIEGISLLLGKFGNPTDDLIVVIVPDISQMFSVEARIPAADLPAFPGFVRKEIFFPMSIPTTTLVGLVHVILVRTGPLDLNNWPGVYVNTNDPYPNGVYFNLGFPGGNPGPPARDVIMSIFGTLSNPQ